ncbi:hypothetical protein HDU67_007167 [Dinochytrium kinnereticum]|nr:hypothetical protein HDU67_007167 [Dinochytrium kinnereticum]
MATLSHVQQPRRLSEADSRLLKEVKLFARLSNHPNVVNYHTAWIEPVESFESPDDEDDDEDEEDEDDDDDDDEDERRAGAGRNVTKKTTTTTTTITTALASATSTPFAPVPSINAMMMNLLTSTTTTTTTTTTSENDHVVFHSDTDPMTPSSITPSLSSRVKKKKRRPGPALSVTSIDSSAYADSAHSSSNLSMSSATSSTTSSSNTTSESEGSEPVSSFFRKPPANRPSPTVTASTLSSVSSASSVVGKKPGVVVGKRHNATLFIQMQLCPFKDLRRWIGERERVERTENLEVLRQIVDGLVHVHSQNVIHRDLKPDNIFIDEDRHILLGDFGLAKSIAEYIVSPSFNGVDDGAEVDSSTDQGTYLYIAPEILKLQVCTTRSDIYSLGVLVVELFQGFETGMERAVTLNNLKTKGVIPSTIPSDVADLVERLIHPDPASRPSALEILADPLLADLAPPSQNLSTFPPTGRAIPIRSSHSPLSSSISTSPCHLCPTSKSHSHTHAPFRPGTSAPVDGSFLSGRTVRPGVRVSPPHPSFDDGRSVRRSASSFTVMPGQFRRGSFSGSGVEVMDDEGFVAGPVFLGDDFVWEEGHHHHFEEGSPGGGAVSPGGVYPTPSSGSSMTSTGSLGRRIRHAKSTAAVGSPTMFGSPFHAYQQQQQARRMRSFSGHGGGVSSYPYPGGQMLSYPPQNASQWHHHPMLTRDTLESPSSLSSSSSSLTVPDQVEGQHGANNRARSKSSGFPSLNALNNFFGGLFNKREASGEEDEDDSLSVPVPSHHHLLAKRKSLPTLPDFTAGLSTRPTVPTTLGESPPLRPGETPKDRIRALEEDVSVLVARLEAMHMRQMVMEAELEGRVLVDVGAGDGSTPAVILDERVGAVNVPIVSLPCSSLEGSPGSMVSTSNSSPASCASVSGKGKGLGTMEGKAGGVRTVWESLWGGAGGGGWAK